MSLLRIYASLTLEDCKRGGQLSRCGKSEVIQQFLKYSAGRNGSQEGIWQRTRRVNRVRL